MDNKKRSLEEELELVTLSMLGLERVIQIEQKYITKHGDKKDEAEHDIDWEIYKINAQSHLDAWQKMKELRDDLKSKIIRANN